MKKEIGGVDGRGTDGLIYTCIYIHIHVSTQRKYGYNIRLTPPPTRPHTHIHILTYAGLPLQQVLEGLCGVRQVCAQRPHHVLRVAVNVLLVVVWVFWCVWIIGIERRGEVKWTCAHTYGRGYKVYTHIYVRTYHPITNDTPPGQLLVRAVRALPVLEVIHAPL